MCRQEVGDLLVELLKQHLQPSGQAAETGGDDE
jgi:hypothetical protein